MGKGDPEIEEGKFLEMQVSWGWEAKGIIVVVVCVDTKWRVQLSSVSRPLLLVCCDKVLQTEWIKEKVFVFPQFWR